MAAPNILRKEVTDLTVANTTRETAVFLHSVPSGTITAEGILRFSIVGDYLNNNATTDTLTLRLKFGGTVLYEDAVAVSTTNASRRPFNLEFGLANRGATNDQCGGGVALLGAAGGTTVGVGNLSTSFIESVTPLAAVDTAVDTTSAQVFEVTAQWGTANANLSFRRRLAVLVIDRVILPLAGRGSRKGTRMSLGIGR